MPITRRIFLLGGAGFALSACVQDGTEGIVAEPTESGPSLVASSYGPLSDEPFPIPAVDLKKLKPKYRRRLVDFPTSQVAGTIIVDTPARYLYLVLDNAKQCVTASASVATASLGARPRPHRVQARLAALDAAQ
jgi:lipoprotein-anchoring transpeptidase ErfK/SrfK